LLSLLIDYATATTNTADEIDTQIFEEPTTVNMQSMIYVPQTFTANRANIVMLNNMYIARYEDIKNAKHMYQQCTAI